MRTSCCFLFLLLLLPLTVRADLSRCSCDPANADSMQARECGLCREAEKQPADVSLFYLKDNNPRKPNRWLVLPRSHKHTIQELTAKERIELWEAAVAKGKDLWGDGWGLALNGNRVRTQCHAHIHIGKFLPAVENKRNVIFVTRASQIPVPKDDSGIWVHPVGKKLHVHLGEQTNETTLLK